MRQLLDQLADRVPGGYHARGPAASEPTAWAVLALIADGRLDPARRACDWLRGLQARDGSVGVTANEPTPSWPTSLAMLAWQTWSDATGDDAYRQPIERATRWTLSVKGRTTERKPQIGHDTTLVGWSWAADTHSWLEPTSLFVRALRTVGRADHERTREAVRLLVDRLLPTGGANYGNTRVLDQYLLPHVQPTGVVLWALAEEDLDDPRVGASLDYLQAAVEQPLGTPSLAYALMGLAAHGRHVANAEQLVADAHQQLGQTAATYQLALLAMARQQQQT